MRPRRRLPNWRARQRSKTRFGAISLGLKDVANDAEDVGSKLYNSIKNAFDGMTDALTDFAMTGKLSFTDLANSIIRDMIRIMIQQRITGPLAAAAGNINWGGVFGGTGTGGVSGGMATAGGYVGGSYAGFHKGGMGTEPTFYRFVPNLDLLPRFHTGIGPGEKPAVITDDESVMTPDQRKDFFKMASEMGASRGSGSPQSVKVEIVNQSDEKLKVADSRVDFNAQEMVITLFLDALNRNAYGLRNALGG